MTLAQITERVMALSRSRLTGSAPRRSWGWEWRRRPGNPHGAFYGPGIAMPHWVWNPSTDRNQSRMVTDKVTPYVTVDEMLAASETVKMGMFWWLRTPDQETRAALIAHMIHKQEVTNATN